MFIIIAIAFIGLICVGVVGLAFVYLTVFSQPQAEPVIAVAPTSDQPAPPTATPTNTATPSPTATETPLPTATGTPVIGSGDNVGAEDAEASEDGEALETESDSLLPTARPTLDPSEVTPTNTRVIQDAVENQASDTEGTSEDDAPEEMPVGGGVVSEDNVYLMWAGIGTLIFLIVGLMSRLLIQIDKI